MINIKLEHRTIRIKIKLGKTQTLTLFFVGIFFLHCKLAGQQFVTFFLWAIQIKPNEFHFSLLKA